MRQFRVRLVSVLIGLTLLAPQLATAVVLAQDAAPAAERETNPVLLLAAPGLRADFVEAFAEEGEMPAMAAMRERGATAGLLAPFSATIGTELTSLLTGTSPGEHGVVGDRFYRTGSPDFANWTNWDDPDIVQADTLPQAAERAGKQVVAVGWPGLTALDPALSGPVVGDPVALSPSGALVNVDLADQPARADRAGVAYQRIDFQAAEGWTDAPPSFSPAQETTLEIPSLDPSGINPDRSFAVYVYDATDDQTVNYDRVLVALDEDGANAVADLKTGAWGSVPVTLSGDRDGQTAGFWLKPIDLAPDLSEFRLFYTPIARFAATWNGCADQPACTGPDGFAEAVNTAVGPPMVVDAAALDAGLVDEGTFAAQGMTAGRQAVDALRYVIDDLGVSPDLLLLGTSLPDVMSRQFLGLVLDETAGGVPTPAEDKTMAEERRAFLRESYQTADQLLAVGQNLLGDGATSLVVAAGTLVPSSMVVNAGQVLVDAGLAEEGQPANCEPGPVAEPTGTPDPEALPAGPRVKACWSGGTAHIYLNLDGREAAGSVSEEEYDALRDAIVAAFEQVKLEESLPGDGIAAMFKEELRGMGPDAIHPSRSGDVVVVVAPPYRFGDGGPGEVTAKAATRAERGYFPVADDRAGESMLLATGPGIRSGEVALVGAAQIAPTVAFLLDVPGPHNASGTILFDLLRDGPSLREVTLLDISDFHGQLTPLSAAADDIEAEGAVNERYDVGGVAYLAPWFDRFRDAARGETVLVTAGDAVGATPPISNVFGDLPTIEAMNMLGFTADSLGNHNFDADADYMFGTLAPAADFTYLSVNLVPARADATPAPGTPPFQASLTLDIDGVQVGLIGFSNPDIPQLTRPGALDPWRVIEPSPAINAEAARLRGQGAQAVIAMGHMGATGGTLTAPTGPVVEVANQLEGVDVVVADHTDFQVSALLANDVLLVENRSKGVMFTRVRVVVDEATGEVVYRTADHHRPWTIGVTPDEELAASLEALETELAPILGEVIGSATQPILRADSCGMETGRTCESLIGNVITDAMRTTYGTDFAITNSGGIRADLTCPAEGGEFCPAEEAELAITNGQVLTVLPFGNVVVTLEVTGAELKAMLEAGVGRMPEPSGAFPQVSGLCFTYNVTAEPGNRVTGAVRQAADGTCTGEALDLTDAATYTVASNDFTASGGDGYPDILARANTRSILADVVAAYVAGEGPLALPGETLAPALEGRIACEGEGCP